MKQDWTKLFFEPGATNSPQIVCLKSVQKKNKSAIVLLIEQKIPIFVQWIKQYSMLKKETLKEILLENRKEVSKQQVISRHFQFEEFGNYVLVGIRRAGKSFMLYQRIQELQIGRAHV